MQLGVEAVGIFVLAASVFYGMPMCYGKLVWLSPKHGFALPYCQTVSACCLVLPISLAGYKGYLKILFGCRGIEFGQFLLHPAAGGIGSIGHGFGFAEVGHGGQGAQEGIDVLRA